MGKFIDAEVRDGKITALVNQRLRQVLGQLDGEQVEAVQAFLLYERFQLEADLIRMDSEMTPGDLRANVTIRGELKKLADRFGSTCEISRKAQGMEAIV